MSKVIFSLVFLFFGMVIGLFISAEDRSISQKENGIYLAQCWPDRFNGKVEKKNGRFYTLSGNSVWLPFEECSIKRVDN